MPERTVFANILHDLKSFLNLKLVCLRRNEAEIIVKIIGFDKNGRAAISSGNGSRVVVRCHQQNNSNNPSRVDLSIRFEREEDK